MRRHLTNAAVGVLDYASYPVGMLVVAPVLLRHLGVVNYGIWTIAMSAVSAGGIIASGLGDAHIQYVASLRAAGDEKGIFCAVRSALSLNLILGGAMAAVGGMAAPVLARHIVSRDMQAQMACLGALRIACVLMLARALESVCISTLRAFELYVDAVAVSIASRVSGFMAAAWLACLGTGPAEIMSMTGLLLVGGTAFQLWRLKTFLAGASLRPWVRRDAVRALLNFGKYSWLQAIVGLLFGQFDRLLVGVALGAATVTSYALCVQMAQPIFGGTAAALHFLFPFLTGRMASITRCELRKALLIALAANFGLVMMGSGLLLVVGPRLLQAWAGAEVASTAQSMFSEIVTGSGLLGLSVTGTYALLALRRVRLSAAVGVGSSLIAAGTIWLLLPSRGVEGLAAARLVYGSLSLLVYLPLAGLLLGQTPDQRRAAAYRAEEVL